MSIDRWKQQFDQALSSAGRDVTLIGHDMTRFVREMTLIDQILLRRVGFLALIYTALPGVRAGAGPSAGHNFTGLLLLFVLAGIGTCWLVSGRISL